MRCLTDYCALSVNRYMTSIQWRKLYDFVRDSNNPARELWRLKLNFLVLLVLSFVSGLGYSTILASFHQFITNPDEESLTLFNGTELHYILQIHPGLDKSEFFYSWTVAVYSIGEIVFALTFGYATRWIPYWYLLLIGILTHTVGNIFYALATTGWMMMVARFLTGGFSGVIETIVYAYISEREDYYQKSYVLNKNSSSKRSRIKDHTYALHTFTITLSYLCGPILTAIAGQFPEVNQFRWVGWFNTALGMASVVILVALFHGEYKSHFNKRSKSITKMFSCDSIKNLCYDVVTKPSLIRLSVLGFFLLASYVMDSSYGVVDTLFNPILTDNFGFTERDISYFFIGAMVVYVLASLFLLLLNTMKLNIRLLAIFSIVISIAGAAIMTDWQSIGDDPCTKYSLFHYPELLQDSENISLLASSECISLKYNESDIHSQMQEKISRYTRNELPSASSTPHHHSLRLNCSDANATECLQCTPSADNRGCVSYRVNTDDLCFEMSMDAGSSVASENKSSTVCSISSLPFSACLNIRNSKSFAESDKMKIKTAVVALTEEMLHLQSNDQTVESEDTQPTAREACLQSEDDCYWNPLSRISQSPCHACPPICRSVSRSLNFAQFCTGVVVFILAIPMARLALMVLISDYVDTEDQGPFTGIVVAAGGFSRAVSPIWLDAAYEGVQKRTFLAMLIKIATFVPVLLGLLVCYTQFKPKEKDYSYSSDEEGSDAELLSSSAELLSSSAEKSD